MLRYGKYDFSAADFASVEIFVLAILVFGSRLAAMVIFARALAGFHGTRTGWAALAMLLALVATGLVFGLFDPPGRYGLHLVIGGLARGGGRTWLPPGLRSDDDARTRSPTTRLALPSASAAPFPG